MGQRKLRATALILLLLGVVLYAVASVRWIPDGQQELVRRGQGDSRVLGPGLHRMPLRGAERFRYPTGEWTFEFPADAGFRVLNRESLETVLGLRFVLRIPMGSADEIHRFLGEDLDASLDLAVQRLAAAHAGDVPGEATAAQKEKLLQDITAPLEALLDPAGIEVRGAELTRWAPMGVDPVDRSLATERAPRRVIFVGVDGADWTIIDPMIEAGLLPNFARLRAEGATGDLRSMEPLLSPLLWTTMATGALPEVHGVLDFNVEDPATGQQVPINRMHRRVDAVWNFLSDFDRRVAVIGWIATHPPERVNGWVLSDRLGMIAQGHAAAKRLGVADVVSPAARAPEIEPLIVRHPELEYDDARRFMRIDEALFLRSRDLQDGADRRVSNFLSLYAAARTYHAAALKILEEEPPDLLTVYLDFVDASCHLFMPAAPPRREEVSDEDFARFGGSVEAVYREQDRMLGELMRRCGDGSLLMIASDHGFKSGEARLRGGSETWTGQAPRWHRLDGILAFWGDGARAGHSVEGATLMDVAPTLLALAGLPRADDMTGRVLREAFTDELVSAFSPHRVATLERRRADEAQEWDEDPAVSAEITRKLQALGYISVAEEAGHRNRAERLQTAGNFAEAIVEYRKALEEAPEDASILNNLAVCLEKTGRFAEAERNYLAAIEISPRDFYAMNNLAVFYLGRRQPERALPWAQRAVEIEPSYANAHLTFGSALGMLGRLDDAERQFRRVLELEPGDRRAEANLQQIRDARARSGG